MKNKSIIYKKGFVGIFFIVIITILLLSYQGFDLKKIFSSEAVRSNFSFAWEMIVYVWVNFLSKPFTFIWGEALQPLAEIMWKAFLVGVDGIRSANASK